MSRRRYCQDCQTPIDRQAKNHRCKTCNKNHCHTCHTVLLEPRAAGYCLDCNRKRAQEVRDRLNPICSYCGKPAVPGRVRTRCEACRDQIYLEERERELRKGVKHCLWCGETYPAAKVRYLCLPCDRMRLKRLKQRKGRVCRSCGGKVTLGYGNQCVPCSRTDARVYRAVYRGDPAAKTLLAMRRERTMPYRVGG